MTGFKKQLKGTYIREKRKIYVDGKKKKKKWH